MPIIQKPERKPRPPRKETDMRKLRREAYNSSTWKKLRETYLKNNPLCEECLKKGKVTPATSVHHKISPFKGGVINWGVLLDYNNLESVDHECHAAIHNKEQGHISPEEVIRQLDALFDENKPDSEFEE